MSNLGDGLQQSLDRCLQQLQRQTPTWSPQALERERVKICGTREVPMFDPRATNRFDEAIARLIDGGVRGIEARDHVVLAYNLAEAHSALNGQSLLGTLPKVTPLLEHWRNLLGARGSLRQVWRGSLLSLFRGQRTDAGFGATRQFLADTLKVLRSADFRPAWLEAMQRHPNLLTEKAVDAYAKEWIEGRRESVQELTELLELPEKSWFWTSLIEGIVKACCETPNDALFDERWPIALSMIKDHPSCRNFVLGGVLERYARKKVPARNDDLLQVSLEAWGSPQPGADSTGRWLDTSKDASTMVSGWLAEEDLEDFAEFCKGDESVDARRLAYWLRFKKQITFSRIVLGTAITNEARHNRKYREFIARKKGRLGNLVGTPHDNAIILRIADWWFVEFSKKGNACYPYRNDVRPFDPTEQYLGLSSDLKNPRAVQQCGGERLHHMSEWEERFDIFLSERGIWPDDTGKVRASRPVVRVSNVPAKVKPAETVMLNVRLSAIGLDQRLIDSLQALSPRLVDHRSNGGAFWIELKQAPQAELKVQMQRHGFRYSSPRGFYRK